MPKKTKAPKSPSETVSPVTRRIKVGASFSGTIPTGSFENSRPGFSAEVEYETTLEGDDLYRQIDEDEKRLHDIAFRNFEIVADQARVDKIKSDFKGFRFYDTPYGRLPSVTTVLDPNYRSWVNEERLKVITSEGNLQHARVHHFIRTGKWVDFTELEGVANDLLVCRGVFLDYFDFPAFVEKYGLTDLKNCGRVVNPEARYAGTPDFEALAEGFPTLFDLKRTMDKVKNFTQISAYAKCPEMAHIRRMGIIQTWNPKTEQKFGKPVFSDQIDRFYELFDVKRKAFEKEYGV